MIKLTSFRLLLSLSLVLLIGMMVACNKKDSLPNDGKAALYSFGPTGTKHGDTLRFIGVNLDKVSSIKFTGINALVDKSNFKTHASDLIKLIVPVAAEKGYVTLRLSGGDSIVTKTQLNLNVLSTVASITAQARPGENITITGTYLNWIDRITFAKDKLVTNFVSKSQNQIVVRIPDDAQTGPLVLHYSGTDSADFETTDTLKVKLPVATSITPNPVKHNTNLTITGTDIDLVKKVWLPGVSKAITNFVSQSATQLVVNIDSSTVKGKIKLEALSEVQSTFNTDLEVVLPAINDLSPNPIDTGANLTITGTNLDLVTGVAFVGPPNAVTNFVSQSPTQLVVTVPGGTLKGKIVLSVLNSSLKVTSDDILDIKGGLPPLPDFPLAIYTDGTQNGFQNWSWAANDFNSTENVRQGTKSIKATYDGGDGYQGIYFHSDAGPATSGYTKLEFSVFGTPGTGGKQINMVVNGGWSNPPQVTIVEGEWTTFSVNLSTFGVANFNELVLQSAGWGGTIYIDHVGLR